MGAAQYGIDRAVVERIVIEIAGVLQLGVEIAVVVGGGIFFAA